MLKLSEERQWLDHWKPSSKIGTFVLAKENYPQTDKSREALLRLASAYDAIRYHEDKKEVCATLADKYPKNAEVLEACGSSAATSAASRDSVSKVAPAAKRDSTVKRDSTAQRDTI